MPTRSRSSNVVLLRVPMTPLLRHVVGACREMDSAPRLGTGVPTDPVFDVSVALDGPPIRVIRRVELAVAAQLRTAGVPGTVLAQVRAGITGELVGVHTGEEFLLRLRSLVRDAVHHPAPDSAELPATRR
jgi:hypothetical protein